MTCQKNHRRIHAVRRRGQAAIELTFFLPMLVALWSIIFLASSLTLSRSHASLGARNKAFSGRHEPWQPSGDYDTSRLSVPGASAVGLILGPAPRQPADGGLLHAEDTRSVDVRFGPLKRLVRDVTTEHYVLGGSWDLQEIEFREHPRLTLTEKSAYFGIGIPLNAFAGLLGFGSGGGGGGNAIASTHQAFRDARNQLQRLIDQLESDLRRVRSDLDTEKNKENPDRELVARLEGDESEIAQQIRKVRGQLEDVTNQQQHLEQALPGTQSGGGPGEVQPPDRPLPIGQRIASEALDRVGSGDYAYEVDRPPLGPDTNKCNLFVYDVLDSVGKRPPLRPRPLPWQDPRYPPIAGDYANPEYEIPGLPVVAGPPLPGDIIAIPHDYADASGHVAIVVSYDPATGTGKSVSVSSANGKVVTSDWGFRPGQSPTIRRPQ